MKLSIVTTLYNSADFIRDFHNRMSNVASMITDNYEIVYVNDGSQDSSLNLALEIYKKHSEFVKLVDLTRNFGHHKAIMTGLSYAEGDYVFLIDSDLEEEPELLLKFWEHLNAKSCDVVIGVQNSRKGGLFEKISGGIFYRIFNLFSSHKVPQNLVTARLMSRRFVQSLIEYKERELFFAGLCTLAGYTQLTMKVTKGANSTSQYSLTKKIEQMVRAITSFSSKPLYCIFYLGLLMSTISFLIMSYIIIQWIFFYVSPGYTGIMASLWFLGGLLMLSIGIMGIYISKIFIEVKQRPYVQVKKVYKKIIKKKQ